jgi:predicted PurR-regulated permease PerM
MMDVVEPAQADRDAEAEQKRVEQARRELQGSLSRGGKALGTLAVLAVIYTLYFAASIVLPFVLAIVLFLLLSPIMRFLHHRLHLPRTLAALLMIILLVAVTAGLGAALSVPASGWIAKAPESVPMLEKKLGFLREPIAFAQKGMQQLSALMSSSGDNPGAHPEPPPQPAQSAPGSSMSSRLGSIGSSILMGTGAALGQVFTVLLLLFFLLSSGDTMLRRLVEVLPTWEDKKRAVQIAVEIERNVAGYLATITMMNALVGLLAGGAMWLLGMPDPLLWGTLAFLLNYVPIIGPVTGIGIFFIVGVFTDDTILQALIPPAIYLGIHVLEGETITPMLLAKRLTLNPVLVIASLLFWDWLWGIPGALLSVPLLAVFKIVCDRLPGLAALGHMLGAEK